MSTEFTASNGVKITTGVGGEHQVDGLWVSPEYVDALTEFVVAQQDKKYGRVRLPEHPDYVIYELPDDYEPKKIRIVHEGDLERSYTWNRHLADADVAAPAEHKLVARLYFERHPEPTPLPTEPGIYADKDGEAWRLEEGRWYFGNMARQPEQITHLAPFTRLVPEVTS